MRGSYLLIIVIFLFAINDCFGQTDDIESLSLDELMAVDLDKKSKPIFVDEKAMDEGYFNVGLVFPESKFEAFSFELLNAATLAAEQINKELTKEKKINLILADDASEVQFSVSKVKELLTKYHTAYIVGPTNSSRFLTVAKNLTKEDELLMISPSATAVEISSLHDPRVYRTAPSDALQAKIAAYLCKTELNKTKAAVFYIDNNYGNGLKTEFNAMFTEMGGTIIGESFYSPLVDLNQFDIQPRLDEALKNNPEILYIISNNIDLNAMAGQFEANKYINDNNLTIVLTDASKGSEMVKSKVFEGAYGTSPASITDEYFLNTYKQRFGNLPTHLEAGDVYDIVYLVAMSHLIKENNKGELQANPFAKISTGEVYTAANFGAAKTALSKGKTINFQGVTGDLDFDENGDIQNREFDIWKISNGEYKPVIRSYVAK